jgi:gluconolactonase
VGAPTVHVTPGAWKCPAATNGTPTLEGVTPTRVAGVPPEDGFAMESTFLAPNNLEGPVWIGDALYLSELSSATYDEANMRVAKARILRVGSDDKVSIVVADSGSNGLAVDGDGAIVAAVHKDGTLTRFTLPAGTASYVATGYMGARFNAPNDLAIRSDGNIYFSDPSWQAPAVLPQAATRLYRISPEGDVSASDDALMNPNGVTLSLDETSLYVAARTGRRYALMQDGSIGAGQDFAPMSGVDGVAIDCAGNLYVARGREVAVYDASANPIGSITVPDVQSATNLAFGGADRKTLYITGLGPRRGLFKLSLDIAGRPY